MPGPALRARAVLSGSDGTAQGTGRSLVTIGQTCGEKGGRGLTSLGAPGQVEMCMGVWAAGLFCRPGIGRESQAEGFAGGTFHPSTSEMPKGFSVFSRVVIGWQSWKWGPTQGPAAGVQALVGPGRTSIVQWLGHGGKEEGKADRLEAGLDLGSEG